MPVTACAGWADITPDRPLPLAGFVERRGLSSAIEDRLEVAGVCFRDADGRVALILSYDLMFVGGELADAVVSYAVSTFGVRPADIMLLASHTHFAPATDSTKPILGVVDDSYLRQVIAASRAFVTRLIEAEALPARLLHGRGSSEAAINRRLPWPLPNLGRGRFAWGEAVMAPNADGALDKAIDVIRVVGEGGATRAILWRYTCHPTGFPDATRVGPDYIGPVRRRLRGEFGDDVPVVFLPGFAGDARPRTPDRPASLHKFLDVAIHGPCFTPFDLPGWRRWCDALAGDVLQAAQAAEETQPAQGRLASAACDLPLERVVDGAGGERAIAFRRLVVGNTLDLVAVGAEPLVGLRALVPWPGAWPVGYLSDVFGYWPTDADIRLGGYEVRDFLGAFGLSGRLRNGLDDVFRRSLAGLERVT